MPATVSSIVAGGGDAGFDGSFPGASI